MPAPDTPSALQPRAFTPLPLGEIRPTGWLLQQLRIQADGLSGHLDEFWRDVAESAWIGGAADGWERGPYWLDGMVPLAYLLDDDRLIAKVTKWVDTILGQQTDDGWLGTASDARIRGDGSVELSHAYDPWPRFIVLKALTQVHDVTGDPRIVPAIQRFLRRLASLAESRSLRSWGRYRWADLVVTIHWLYARTGEAWLLDLAATMHEQGFDWAHHARHLPVKDRSLREECDLSTHVVNNAMGVKSGGVWFRQSGDPDDAAASLDLIAALDRWHGQATGVFTGDEHLAGRHPSQGTELCAVVELLYSLETLVSILGEPALADRIEQVAYNALPATFSPDMWAHQYVQQVNQVETGVYPDRVYTSNGPDANVYGLEPHFGCCTANMHQGWPKVVSHLWMRTADDGLAMTVIGPCSVHTTVQGVAVEITVETEYPFAGAVAIALRTASPVTFPLALRIPGWARGATLAMGNADATGVAPGTFHTVRQEWTGDTTLTLSLPMPVRVERREGDSVALHRGPLLLAHPLAERWEQIAGDLPHADWAVHPESPWAWAVVLDDAGNPMVDVGEEPMGTAPFSPQGAPVRGTVQAVPAIGWDLVRHAAGPLPGQASVERGASAALPLVPYGSTNLRIAVFPTVRTPPTGSG